VLSIGKLGKGQESYYLESVAQGIEDYYTGSGEAPGRWLGSATRGLGVEGEVDDDALGAALGGSNPSTGDALTSQRAGARVPGFDLTFRAPKSVSVLFGLADSEISAQVRDAHEAAVESALDYMERHAAVARRGRGGVELVPGNGFVAAAFRHRTSRAGDPQLHTHVLVANMTKGRDGRWTALDGRKLYAHAKTGGYLYQAELRRELVQRLGVEWGPVHNGAADIVGVPQPVLRAFSRRRAEIERTMAERGEHSAKAAQVAALDTRQAKDYGVGAESLRERWRDQASRLGFEWERITELTGRAGGHELTPIDLEAAVAHLASPQGLTRDRASFTRRDVIQAWCDRLPDGATVAVAEGLADEFLDSEHSVPLATDVTGLTHSDVIRRADGRVIAATSEERRHSTPELLAVEKRLVESTLGRRDEGAGVVADPTVAAALRRRPTLSDEQGEMVRRLTRGGDGVQLVTGKAGTGKTFALDAAREAWQAEGYSVIGAAVARRAAHELQDGAGIESTSLAALLQDLRQGGGHGLPARAVVVVDEASMAGTRQLGELLEFAERARTKVVLIGDPHQLPEIDAGGAFRALLTRSDPIELTHNRRQHEAWEREALDHLRAGRAEEAIARYERHGRVVLGEGAEDVRQRLVADWWSATGEGEAAMIAARRDDVADLNVRAREFMRANGQLAPDALWVGEREFAVGDHVVALKNARHLGVVNGTRATVRQVDGAALALDVRTSDGRDLTLPRTYLEATTQLGGRTLDHGYAITGHKAQGMTTGKAFVLGTEDLYREWGYVAMSRGSVENHLYVVAPRERERDEYAPTHKQREPLEALIGSLEYSQAQTAALDVAARDGIGRMTTVELAAERRRLDDGLGDARERSGELERVSARHAEAEQALADARSRIQSAGGNAEAADHAIEAHARERARELAARKAELENAAATPGRRSVESIEDVVRRAAVGDELDRRSRGSVRAAVVARPDYLMNELGPYPHRRSKRRAWQRAAMRVEGYRQEFGIRDQQRALGDEPRELRQRSAFRETRREIERAQRQLSRERGRQAARGRELR
jgi:conjugative relaxase-like TrwC/TraI family protein